MRYKVTLARTEWADLSVEADSPKAAKSTAAQMIQNASSVADLNVEWWTDQSIAIGSVEQESEDHDGDSL